MKQSITLGIVGVTGFVGQSALDILQSVSFNFSVKKLKLYASQNSIGKVIQFNGKNITLEMPNVQSLSECNAVLFVSDASVSQEFIPPLAQQGIFCIDKSSAFRMHKDVPLIVPEVNGSLLLNKNKSYIIASPNCVAIPLVRIAHMIHQKYTLKSLIVSTYQSVSGTGKAGMDILLKETQEFLREHDFSSKNSAVYPKTIAFNVIPFVESLDEDGHTGEEIKIREETQKILNHSSLLIDVTSVRVPTFVGHAMSVVCHTQKNVLKDEFLADAKKQRGIKVSKEKDFMTPREVHGKNEVFLSRVRKSNVFKHGISFWIACDNLRKGAALNALQIIEAVLTEKH